MNQYIRTGLAILGVLGITLQTAAPHASWIIPVTTAITAVLAAFHIKPETPAQ